LSGATGIGKGQSVRRFVDEEGDNMRKALVLGGIALILAATVVASPAPPSGAQPAHPLAVAQIDSGTRSIPASGTTSIRALPTGTDGFQQP
jgi:hypothetical protein